MRFENERSDEEEQKIKNGEEEQKIKNGLITFKISHVAAIKQYNSGEREEEKHHEICFRRP